MQQRITKVSCSPEQLIVTLKDGTRIQGRRNLVSDTILTDMLLHQFLTDTEEHSQEEPKRNTKVPA